MLLANLDFPAILNPVGQPLSLTTIAMACGLELSAVPLLHDVDTVMWTLPYYEACATMPFARNVIKQDVTEMLAQASAVAYCVRLQDHR